MFDPELSDQFAEILERKLSASRQLADLLRRISRHELREPIAQLHASAQRDVQLSQRLVEIVS